MKHIFDKQRVAYTTAYACATMIMLQFSSRLSEPAQKYLWVRYTQQITYVITFILAVITFNSIKKLIPKTLRRSIIDKMAYIARKAAASIAKVSNKILKAIGLGSSRYKKSKDEKSFIFDFENIGIFKKLQSIKNSLRWRDLNENPEKIRFLYIKYILKLIKSGNKIEPVSTPSEIKFEFKLDDLEDGRFIDLYNGARYSGGSVIISDNDVDFAISLVNEKKKSKRN